MSGCVAPRLAVPCGTHCWLPPWHLPFPSLLWRCVCGCCSIQLCEHAAPSCPIGSAARIIGRLTGLFVFRGRAGRALDGQAARRGEADGATLTLHRYVKRSSKDTERRDRGRIQSVQCVCPFFCEIQVFLIEFEEKWGFPK